MWWQKLEELLPETFDKISPWDDSSNYKHFLPNKINNTELNSPKTPLAEITNKLTKPTIDIKKTLRQIVDKENMVELEVNNNQEVKNNKINVISVHIVKPGELTILNDTLPPEKKPKSKGKSLELLKQSLAKRENVGNRKCCFSGPYFIYRTRAKKKATSI